MLGEVGVLPDVDGIMGGFGTHISAVTNFQSPCRNRMVSASVAD